MQHFQTKPSITAQPARHSLGGSDNKLAEKEVVLMLHMALCSQAMVTGQEDSQLLAVVLFRKLGDMMSLYF
jgi:hypothetical protein